MNSFSQTFLLAIDTCGPSGSIALGRVGDGGTEVALLGEILLEGRTYSSTLVAAVAELLAAHDTKLAGLSALVAVRGPGSFTGVRVGLAAIKGLAEPAQIPVVAVSRLEVLAAEAGLPDAALDAHRHEIFLRHAEPGAAARELLAGAEELAALTPPARIATCDEAAAALLREAWPQAEIVETLAPTAAAALRLALPRFLAGDFEDLALLDGHYLRRSDAEIFGDPVAAQPRNRQQARP